MGIYVFNRDIIVKLLENEFTDFGKHNIAGSLMVTIQRVHRPKIS